jgi:hypothetical protein
MLNKATFTIACFALFLALVRNPLSMTALAQLPNTSIGSGTGAPTNCGTSSTYAPGSVYIQSSNGHLWTCTGVAWVDDSAAGGVPSGLTAMVVSGSCPSGYTEVSALNAAMPLGTVAANGDIGATGGANTVTPTVATLTAAAQAFTGSSATTSAVSAGTPAGTNGTVTGPAQVVSWPAGVPTFTGGAGTVPAETFTGTPFSSVINHTHTITVTSLVQGGTTAATTGTHVMTSTATGGSARAITAGDSITATSANPSGGVASITPAGTNGTAAFTPAGTVAWPAGVPTNATSTIPAETFTGSALGTHTHTLTATGTNGTSSVTGTLNSMDNRSAFVKVIYCTKS